VQVEETTMKLNVKHSAVFLFVALFLLAATPSWLHIRAGNSSTIVSAPHSGSDLNTGYIVEQIAKQTGFASIVVENGRNMRTRWNVNRPTVGGGQTCDSERRTSSAEEAFNAYRSAVLSLNPNPALFIEIHGESGVSVIEAATKGFSRDDASKIKQLYIELRDKRLRGTNFFAYDLLIEPLDSIRLTASCAKTIGLFASLPKVLHMELPRGMRDPPTVEPYTQILAELIQKAAIQ